MERILVICPNSLFQQVTETEAQKGPQSHSHRPSSELQRNKDELYNKE